jgi:hypothetical protein
MTANSRGFVATSVHCPPPLSLLTNEMCTWAMKFACGLLFGCPRIYTQYTYILYITTTLPRRLHPETFVNLYSCLAACRFSRIYSLIFKYFHLFYTYIYVHKVVPYNLRQNSSILSVTSTPIISYIFVSV